MPTSLNTPTTEFEKKDRCADLDHRPRVLLGKMGLDGHDRGVKVIARALRDSGVHVIYSGLWQTPRSLAISARDEDCDCICASMMSNSHLTLGPMLVRALGDVGRPDIPVYMGGILPQEDIPTLLAGGVARCFATGVGLLDIVQAVRESVRPLGERVGGEHPTAQLARDISLLHAGRAGRAGAAGGAGGAGGAAGGSPARRRPARVIGVTGSPGAGKSTLVARLAAEYTRRAAADASLGRCAVVAFDPMSPITSGALLGDRLRVDFNTLDEAIYYRSLAISGEDYHGLDEIAELIGGAGQGSGVRGQGSGVRGQGSGVRGQGLEVGGRDSGAAGSPPHPSSFILHPSFNTLFIETVGAGQNETKIRGHVGRTVVVLTPGMGDAVQMDKAGILEIADVFVCNKADHPGRDALLRDLRDVAGRRPVLETVATEGKGVSELLDALLAG